MFNITSNLIIDDLKKLLFHTIMKNQDFRSNTNYIGDLVMATTKEYKEFILEQLDLLDNITCKAMMGEFLLYYNSVLFGGVYDDRLLVKIIDSNKKHNMKESIPYENANPMYLVEDVDNKEILKEIVIETCKDLPNKK